MIAAAQEAGRTVEWVPDNRTIAEANVSRLMERHGISSLAELRARSFDPEWFWPAVIEDLGLELELAGGAPVLQAPEGPHRARWFSGTKLNLTDSCLGRWVREAPDREAACWSTETGEERRLTYAELDRLANGVAAALGACGVGPGDTVGVFMPLAPETAAALYGCWKLGAIVVPIFSGFGPEAVASRLEDAGARVLLTADAFTRRGSRVEMKAIADQALAHAPGVQRVIVWRRDGTADVAMKEGRDHWWHDLVPADPPAVSLQVDADHPALLIYTSGSTGRPKGAVLTHAGLLVTVAKDSAYHVDLKSSDRLCWVTDIGWIMGTWEIVAAGAAGATVCLIEGGPASPHDRLWRLVGGERITVLGVSPSLIRGLAAAGAEPTDEHDLSSLRILGATGEPWSPAAYTWLHNEVGGGRCPIINISGGSEVGGAFLAPTPIESLETCSLGGPALGMDVAVYDEGGKAVPANTVGELVCRRPWPGMTKSLWKDDERFIETYWSRFPGVWVHGDWASYDEHGQWFLHGRSDDTLNIGGQRIGPAEAEAVLTASDAVADATAIAMPHQVKGEAMWCFVVPAPGAQPDLNALSDAVAAALGKPFRPERIVVVDDLPRTRSQKILRRVVRAVAIGADPGDLSSLENPEAIAAVRKGVSQ